MDPDRREDTGFGNAWTRPRHHFAGRGADARRVSPWLDEMRADKMNGTRTRAAGEDYAFLPYRGHFEEFRAGK
jgi:hypothetical protein